MNLEDIYCSFSEFFVALLCPIGIFKYIILEKKILVIPLDHVIPFISLRHPLPLGSKPFNKTKGYWVK